MRKLFRDFVSLVRIVAVLVVVAVILYFSVTVWNYVSPTVTAMYRAAVRELESDIRNLEKKVADFRTSALTLGARSERLRWKIRERDSQIAEKNGELLAIDNELRFIEKSITEKRPVKNAVSGNIISSQELSSHIEKLRIKRKTLVDVLGVFGSSRAVLAESLEKFEAEASSAPTHLFALEREIETAKLLLASHRDTLKIVGDDVVGQNLTARYQEIKSGIQQLNALTTGHSSALMKIDFSTTYDTPNNDDELLRERIESILNEAESK
ncbi:MAG: hypothetical protein LBQ66_10650 [Planctomycetaceae bacterium]|jgi:chromosome segregation ATPase|nr:hypothetical protein [Planctomycetaceae bacterium]